MQNLSITHHSGYSLVEFRSMASVCQILIDEGPAPEIGDIAALCYQETLRIENKYSRYLVNNTMWAINHSNGHPVNIDEETFRLLEYAQTCYQLSEKLFDISSGALRKIWSFDKTTTPPSKAVVKRFLKFVGWEKIKWSPDQIIVPSKMELDFGGIGKEYAVDRCALLIEQHFGSSFVINYGGDIYVNKPRKDGKPWQIGIETPENSSLNNKHTILLAQGGIATSGNTKRYLMHQGKRYGHILNPITGYPIEFAPLSVTVIAENCLQAGMLATLAMLQGKNAELFLDEQKIKYWIYR